MKKSLYGVDHVAQAHDTPTGNAQPNHRYKAYLARTGLHTYLAHELGLDGGDKITVYRPEAELFSPETVHSFENVPVTLNHPEKLLDTDTPHEDTVGHIHNVRREGNFLVGDMILTDQRAIDFMYNGNEELSIGYTFTLTSVEGADSKEQPSYRWVQKNLRGNHVAIVSRGRCGCQCRVTPARDHAPTPSPTLTGRHLFLARTFQQLETLPWTN